MSKPRLFLIDATAFCYRAFYAIRGLSTSFGQPTNAVYGFMNILQRLLKKYKPSYLAVCFDVSKDTFRKKQFAEYKSNRPPMPDELSSQIPLIKQIVAAYKIPLLEKEGFEADDVIASLAEKAKKSGLSVVVVSQDKDLLQLVGDSVQVLSPVKNEDIMYGAEQVKEKFGLDPLQIPDMLALLGDKIDNIPAIPGITEKRAIELIREYGSIGKLMEALEQVKPEKVREALKAGREQIAMNRQLAELDRSLDLGVEPEGLAISEPDYAELNRLFRYLEFKALLKELPAEEETAGPEIPLLEKSSLKAISERQSRVIIHPFNESEVLLLSEGKTYRAGIEEISPLLSDEKIKKTGHDLKSLKLLLASHGVELKGCYFDTMLACYLLNPSRSSYSIADAAWDYLNKAVKSEGLSRGAEIFLLASLEPVLEQELADKKLMELFRTIEMPLAEILAHIQMTGIALDLKLLEKLSCEVDGRLVAIIKSIYELCGCEFNLNSPKQLREVLFEKLKLPVIKKTKTGPSTDEEVLRALANKHTVVALLLEYRQLSKLKSTYIDALPKAVDARTGRIHTSFIQTGTETGRLSSRDPNLQNIPIRTELGRKIREAIIPFSKDSLLLSCDYSQIELRILAHVSGDPTLVQAFKENKDIHRRTAALVHGVPETDVTDRMRETAKRINFGIVYGLSAFGLSRDLGIPQDEAQAFIDAYFATYPGVKEYITGQIQRAETDGFVTTIFGRRRYLPDICSKNLSMRQLSQRQAVNAPIQGSASDMIKLAMVGIEAGIATLDARLVLQIHDELLLDVASFHLEETGAFVREKMENVTRLAVPVRVDLKAGKNWAQMQDLG